MLNPYYNTNRLITIDTISVDDYSRLTLTRILKKGITYNT